MASTYIDVTPEELVQSSARLGEKIQAFRQTYNNIYAATSELQVSYQGLASKTFNDRIEEYKNDFDAAYQALTDYIQFLQDYAKKLADLEEELKAKASALSIGK